MRIMTKITHTLFIVFCMMLYMSCKHSKTDKQKEEIVIADTFIWSEAPPEPTEEEKEVALEKRIRDKIHEDSIWAYVKFPKPEVELAYKGDKEYAIAKRVHEIYDDVLETMNYLHCEDKDFFKLYWSKSLYSLYEKACKHDDCVLGAYPYTNSQEHAYRHLYKVIVGNVKNERATVNVIFGVYGTEEIYMQKMILSLLYERGNWYIDDMSDGEAMSVREEIKESLHL